MPRNTRNIRFPTGVSGQNERQLSVKISDQHWPALWLTRALQRVLYDCWTKSNIRILTRGIAAPPATASHFAPRRLSIFVGLDGEYLEPFCKAERRASSPSPSLPSSGYVSSAGCCLDHDASRGPLTRAARTPAPASRAWTWLSKDATRPRLAAALLRLDSSQTLQRLLPSSARSNLKPLLEAVPSRKMRPPRASTETGEDCSTSSRLYIFSRPPLPC